MAREIPNLVRSLRRLSLSKPEAEAVVRLFVTRTVFACIVIDALRSLRRRQHSGDDPVEESLSTLSPIAISPEDPEPDPLPFPGIPAIVGNHGCPAGFSFHSRRNSIFWKRRRKLPAIGRAA